MNNRYIFRGKRKDSGEWIDGFLYITHNGEHEIGSYDDELDIERITYIVIPETVGQYTGLTDKNGKMIFEGDIVGHYNNYRKKYDIGTVKYGDFNCSCCQGVYGWFFENEDIREHSSCEVLGNIYDNPELLKGE